jgi:sugar phosphate isomerase/epimerase
MRANVVEQVMSTNANQISRRNFFSRAAVFGCTTLLARQNARTQDIDRTIGLGFSVYGMHSLTLNAALDAIAKEGYDCVELAAMQGWHCDAARLSREARPIWSNRIADRGLRITSLMENLPVLGDDTLHSAKLDRFKLAVELARDLAKGGKPPLIETIMGGKAGEFEAVKERLADRLRPWAKVAEEGNVKLAVKAHISNATQQPSQLLWLLDRVASPSLVAAYDFSHFQIQGLGMKETLDALLPRTAFIHVKDVEKLQGNKWRFVLPGEGNIDYVDMFKHLGQSNYQGDVVVEVSAQVSGQLSYDPLAAAHKCYNHLADAFSKAGLKRG